MVTKQQIKRIEIDQMKKANSKRRRRLFVCWEGETVGQVNGIPMTLEDWVTSCSPHDVALIVGYEKIKIPE